jgi:hypothetical protein
MAGWIDKLETHGRQAAKKKKKQPAKPKPKVERVIVTIRPGDPGSARIGYYTVEGELLTMTDENGTPIKNGDELVTAVLEHPSDAHGVASVLTRKRSRGSGMRGFEKGALRYPDGGWRWIRREKKRPFGRLYRTAHFRNCRFATGSVTEFRRDL